MEALRFLFFPTSPDAAYVIASFKTRQQPSAITATMQALEEQRPGAILVRWSASSGFIYGSCDGLCNFISCEYSYAFMDLIECFYVCCVIGCIISLLANINML
jgi:hypothetical protein